MKRLALFTFAFIGMSACESPSAPEPTQLSAEAPTYAMLRNDKIDVSGILFNRCAPSEFVRYTGSLHVVVTGEQTPTSSDVKFHVNTQGVEGIGLTSGDRYSIIQNVKEEFQFSFPPFRFEREVDFRFRMIRQGSDDNLWVRQTFRVSSPPFRLELIRSEIECRG